LRRGRARAYDASALPETAAPLLFDSAFLAKLEQLHLLARRLFRGEHRAERRSRQVGSSLEFADYRNYSWGDEPRTIDWAVYARLDRLFVKLFEQERDLDVHFLIDASASMRWPPAAVADSKLDQARRIAAALAYIALANLDRVNVCWFGETLGEDTGLTRGKPQFHSILEYLRATPGTSEKTSLLASARAFTQRLKRTGLVFVLSDFLDPTGYEEALNLMRHHHFELHLVHVLDPSELSPELLGDLRLTECETGESCEITASEPIVRDYRAAFAAWLDELEQFCLRRNIGYARATTEVPFEDLVLRVLRDGMMLR
jgi:uncharacterized protein (DUF58 family)